MAIIGLPGANEPLTIVPKLMQLDRSFRACAVCGTSSASVAGAVEVCGPCIRDCPDKALPLAMKAHRRSRKAFGLPETPPQAPGGTPCGLCVNACRITPDGMGYCGLRRTPAEPTEHASTTRAKLS